MAFGGIKNAARREREYGRAKGEIGTCAGVWWHWWLCGFYGLADAMGTPPPPITVTKQAHQPNPFPHSLARPAVPWSEVPGQACRLQRCLICSSASLIPGCTCVHVRCSNLGNSGSRNVPRFRMPFQLDHPYFGFLSIMENRSQFSRLCLRGVEKTSLLTCLVSDLD